MKRGVIHIFCLATLLSAPAFADSHDGGTDGDASTSGGPHATDRSGTDPCKAAIRLDAVKQDIKDVRELRSSTLELKKINEARAGKFEHILETLSNEGLLPALPPKGPLSARDNSDSGFAKFMTEQCLKINKEDDNAETRTAERKSFEQAMFQRRMKKLLELRASKDKTKEAQALVELAYLTKNPELTLPVDGETAKGLIATFEEAFKKDLKDTTRIGLLPDDLKRKVQELAQEIKDHPDHKVVKVEKATGEKQTDKDALIKSMAALKKKVDNAKKKFPTTDGRDLAREGDRDGHRDAGSGNSELPGALSPPQVESTAGTRSSPSEEGSNKPKEGGKGGKGGKRETPKPAETKRANNPGPGKAPEVRQPPQVENPLAKLKPIAEAVIMAGIAPPPVAAAAAVAAAQLTQELNRKVPLPNLTAYKGVGPPREKTPPTRGERINQFVAHHSRDPIADAMHEGGPLDRVKQLLRRDSM